MQNVTLWTPCVISDMHWNIYRIKTNTPFCIFVLLNSTLCILDVYVRWHLYPKYVSRLYRNYTRMFASAFNHWLLILMRNYSILQLINSFQIIKLGKVKQHLRFPGLNTHSGPLRVFLLSVNTRTLKRGFLLSSWSYRCQRLTPPLTR